MFKSYFSDADTYITNKIVSGDSKVSASVGYAGTLDLFKLYGISSTSSIELSRILIHFDTENLKKLHSEGKIDITHPSFKSFLKLSDVYGGQPTPAGFNISIFPLSMSFSEGFGKDIVHLTDYDTANFVSSSFGVEWYMTGAGLGRPVNVPNSDYITNFSYGNSKKTQFFKTGEEDLYVDVTEIVSATITGELPDSGFRISFDTAEEENENTYFVKRFASRHAYDKSLQPRLNVLFDDSIQDDSGRMSFGNPGNIFAYHFKNDEPSNFISGNVGLSGSNCIKLILKNSSIHATGNLIFSGSQFSRGTVSLSGTYYSNVLLQAEGEIKNHLEKSGSIKFTPVWTSNDGTIAFFTGSQIKFDPPTSYGSPTLKKKYVVNVMGIPENSYTGDITVARVNIFDQTDPMLKASKFVLNSTGKVVSKCYYRIRDANTNKVIVPFDDLNNSTRVSSDLNGMYFSLDFSSLIPGKSYVIDIMIKSAGETFVYDGVSTIFNVLSRS